MSVCESGQINAILELHDTEEFLSYFELISVPKSAISLSLNFMKTYNLLPNDALILATCKIENIAVLASYDDDFKIAYHHEEVKLISKIEDLA